MTKTVFIITALIFSFSISFAQEKERKQIQASLITPISNHGANAVEYSNDFSLNATVGINGGVNGFELGGVANINKGNVKGCQIGGVANITEGTSKGTIISGTINLASDSTSGFQLAGVTNIVNSSSKGFQLSVANIVKEHFSGFQLGVINIAKSFKGLQFGLINISKDASNGTPIGLVNIIKGGYKAIEATTTETMHARLTYKMGVEKCYTIYQVGYGSYKDKSVMEFGMGLGSLFSIAPKHKVALEATTSQLIYDNQWKGINMLNQLKLNYHFALTPKLDLVAGPVANVYISDRTTDERYGTIHIPSTIYKHYGSKNLVATWIGFNAGICFNL
jgi:hypothetical protein